jgi:serine/threonine-protein kinase HipA
MSRLDVSYDGQKVGTLAEARGGIFFEYEAQFIATGHELSPLNLQLGSGLRSRGSSGMRLPGLFEDSLPDQWGERLMREWFRRQGISSHSITPLMMLSYVGRRAMGALVYGPQLQSAHVGERVDLHDLHEAAMQVETSGTIDLDVLAEVGTSAGGARPKALIGLPRTGFEGILTGASELPPSHDAWMVKLDTSPDASDGVMEEAYALMARAAGVDMPPTRLLESTHADDVRRHFAVKRFDRDGRERIHHHTLAAMCHVPGCDLDYGTLLRVTRRITHDEREVWRAYRRAVFNVLASNRDDHGKNHGFLYRNREWKLGPVYDVTFRGPRQLSERGMAVCGERRSAGRKHLMTLAESEALDRRTVLAVIDEVAAALARWHEFASQARVPAALAADVAFELSVQAKI